MTRLFRRYESPIERKLEESGTISERFLFGRARVESDDYIRDKNQLIERHRTSQQPIDFREGTEIVKRAQPFEPDRRVPQDPTNPVKEFPRRLRAAVAAALGLGAVGSKRVFFFTAVDTFLDEDAGTDSLIEWQRTPGEPSKFVRLDLSRYPEDPAVSREKEAARARLFTALPPQVVIGEVPEVDDPRQLTDPGSTYNKFVDSVAREIAAVLQPPPAQS
ncbi:MAG: hypothetical protein Q8R35_03960 [bacterium]|nr:hypothetical protein [bacterium]